MGRPGTRSRRLRGRPRRDLLDRLRPADTIFRIASITKPFTATLALELLDLEATTGIWPADVRVRHLLSHTSGYDCEAGDLARFGDGDDALAARVAELPGVRRYVGVEQAWSYANTGFWLAGWLAAQASGATYEEALAKHVLDPAGLESTSFGEPGSRAPGRRRQEAPTRGRAGRRAGSSRTSATCCASASGTWRSRGRPSSGSCTAGRPPASTASASSGSGSAASRCGATAARTAGSQTSLLVIPERRRSLRSPDEQQQRRPGAPLGRGRVLRPAARRAQTPAGAARAPGGDARQASPGRTRTATAGWTSRSRPEAWP